MRHTVVNFPIQKQEAGKLLARAFEYMAKTYEIETIIDDSITVKERKMTLNEAIHHSMTTAASPAEKKLSAAYRLIMKQYNRIAKDYRVSSEEIDLDIRERMETLG